ncbi:MAG: biotin--[acetyl-CoA-carboxylase] ligase [candidate division WOR-3 bacterium]|nr:MAG: biotin--[acetyl-CoA-carboxylase] ligase [candidate division WOR-3 bacterium]
MENPLIVGSKCYRLTEIESTNDYAKQILTHAPEGTVVVADVQTAAKGRMGRSWYSPEGGLWMSVLLQHHENYLISLIAGVSICEAFEPYDIAARIKWPNDVFLNDKKIAGTLCEVIDDKIILGIGINLNVRHFPDDLSGKASSVLIETKKHFDTQSFYHHLCRSLDNNYRVLKKKEIEVLLSKWRKHSLMVGREVSIMVHDRVVIGKVLDVDHQGALIVMRADYGIEHVIAGDCRLLR